MELVAASNPVLHKPALYVRHVDKRVLRLVRQLQVGCRTYHGVGLAAPQIGRPLRVAVVDSAEQMMTLIDAEADGLGEQRLEIEGCLSLPGRMFLVARFPQVNVRSRNEFGQMVASKVDSVFLARIIQHELDHLEGLLVSDRGLEVNNQGDLDI